MNQLIGKRIKVFDPRLFIDDKTTPISFTMRPGTIIKYYRDKFNRELIDVKFDHRADISHGHFLFRDKLL